MRNPKIRALPGHANKLGATWDGKGVNFAVFSEHAEKIEICLYDDSGQNEISRIELTEKTGNIWHGYVPGLKPGQKYGIRAHGPYDPANGHRFNPNKLLVDPAAREISGERTYTDKHFGYKLGQGTDSFDHRDNGAEAPKSVVSNPEFDWQGVKRPNIPRSELVVAEIHAKGYTMADPKIPEKIRGTYAALAHPETIKHLKSCGFNAIELLPVHANMAEQRVQERGQTNYWGYNTLSFFAPEPTYAGYDHNGQPKNAPTELKKAIRELHRNGIEVFLDVVFNHTMEHDETGPTMMFRGLDNASYYHLEQNNKRKYTNDTGCANTVNLNHPDVARMVVESLRHWVEEYKVDGFRFDLATVLGREPGYNKNSLLMRMISQDPVLKKANIKLIPEPWDIGPGGYQVGNFPKGWAEWNDKFRDDVRAYWRGDAGMMTHMAKRIAGSANIFDKKGRTPQDVVNFITAHDGMTLNDVVSYNHKHNFANKENNNDGANDNRSFNYGIEGETDDHDINVIRARQKRNMLATLALSIGTPMFLGGDEVGNSQNGNNNPYCLDNEISWVDWTQKHLDDDKLQSFLAKLLHIRKENPVFAYDRFLHGHNTDKHGVKDISWYSPHGTPMESWDWNNPNNRCFGVVFNNNALPKPNRSPHRQKNKKPPASNQNGRLMVINNSWTGDVNFTLPQLPGGSEWRVLLRSDDPDYDGNELSSALYIRNGEIIKVPGRCTLVLEQKNAAAFPRPKIRKRSKHKPILS